MLTGLSSTAVSVALAGLAEHGLAERGPGAWRRGPADLGAVSVVLGVPALLAALQARYRAERKDWRAFLGIVLPLARPQASCRSAPQIDPRARVTAGSSGDRP